KSRHSAIQIKSASPGYPITPGRSEAGGKRRARRRSLVRSLARRRLRSILFPTRRMRPRCSRDLRTLTARSSVWRLARSLSLESGTPPDRGRLPPRRKEMDVRSNTVTGVVGKIEWAYANAAAIHNYRVTRARSESGETWTLRATVINANVFNLM